MYSYLGENLFPFSLLRENLVSFTRHETDKSCIDFAITKVFNGNGYILYTFLWTAAIMTFLQIVFLRLRSRTKWGNKSRSDHGNAPGRDIIQKGMQTLFDKVTVIVLPNLKKYSVTLLHIKVIWLRNTLPSSLYTVGCHSRAEWTTPMDGGRA